ncbi:hypothetical protein Rs2_03442 [Raphanus sativus]|nr:hypothetical protein Rs2_28885 [Raphanus sativus]KAJ4917892.1 hypothetical protein Rs2_03442 [Raphanus sativus]
MIRAVSWTRVTSISPRPTPLGTVTGASLKPTPFRRISEIHRDSDETHITPLRLNFPLDSFIDLVESTSERSTPITSRAHEPRAENREPRNTNEPPRAPKGSKEADRLKPTEQD